MTRRLTRWDPFREFRNMMLNDAFFSPWEEQYLADNAGLRINVYETEEEVVVECDLPGVDPEHVDVNVTSENVTISAAREETEEEKKRDYVRKERRYGSYARTINLPVQVVPEDAEATFKDGMLELRISKREQTGSKPVNVQVKRSE